MIVLYNLIDPTLITFKIRCIVLRIIKLNIISFHHIEIKFQNKAKDFIR